jgi:hypothetical protein
LGDAELEVGLRRPVLGAPGRGPRVRQQQEEQLAVDQFRRVSGLLPGAASRGAEPPDFIILNGGRQTSVETTAFHKGWEEKGGSKAAADESNAQLVTDRAQAIFEAVHPDVHVEVRPVLIVDRIARREVDHHAQLVAEAVGAAVPSLPEDGQPLVRVDVTWDRLPEDVTTVMPRLHISRWRPERWKPDRSSVWMLGSVGYAAIEVGELESIIRRKEQDLPRYRAGFDACWLLIYGVWQASSFFDFDYLKPHMFTSQFDGVGFVDAGTGRNVQIA